MAKYILKQAAIFALTNEANIHNNPVKRAYTRAAAIIEQITAEDVQPVNQWISVKDRLPDEPCECLGVVDGEVTEVSYNPKQKGLICVWSMCDADGFKPLSDDAVTHWMPLPELPQD